MSGTGSFVMQAERVGAEALLAQIVRMVSEAQRSRAPIQRLADVVSSAMLVPFHDCEIVHDDKITPPDIIQVDSRFF